MRDYMLGEVYFWSQKGVGVMEFLSSCIFSLYYGVYIRGKRTIHNGVSNCDLWVVFFFA